MTSNNSTPDERSFLKNTLTIIRHALFYAGSIGVFLVSLIAFLILFGIPTWRVFYVFEELIYLGEVDELLTLFMGNCFFLLLSGIGTYFAVKKVIRRLKKRRYKVKRLLRIFTIITLVFAIGFLIIIDYYNVEIYQYKRQNKIQVTIITQGHADVALRYTELYLKYYPLDAESYYIQALAYTQLNRLGDAMNAISKAEVLGLTFDRFLAGPRNLFSDLYNYSAFKTYASAKNITLIHGPVLGNVRPNNVSVWIRTTDEVNVSVRVSKFMNMSSPITSELERTNASRDFTAIIEVNGLENNTIYYYELNINGTTHSIIPTPSFKTAQTYGAGTQFKIGFGGGAGYNPPNERMWNTILTRDLQAFFFLGDNIYIDAPEVPETQRYCYYRRQSRPEYKNLTASTPIYAIWDDHDFGMDDCTSSLELDNPPWKLSVLDVFKENWVNPFYGNGSVNPGVFFNFTIGDVDFMMLDCRFYRQDPSEFDTPSMLGPGQKQWLFQTLNQTNGTFKVLVSSVPWAPGAKQVAFKAKDTWDGFPSEREEIFSFIEQNTIEGVILISADRHRSDAWRIERETGYPLYEFMSSKLTNLHTHNVLKESLFGYNEKQSFGLVSFDTLQADPEVTYQIVNIDNEVIHSLTLKKSDLTFS